MTSENIRVPAAQLIALVARMFAATGLSATAAERVAKGLVEADLEGLPSHGVMLVDMYIERIHRGSVSSQQAADIVSDCNTAIVLDAGHALGHLTGEQAMTLAVERAKRLGVAVVAVRHGFHFGTAGRYAQLAADSGCIGIAMCNTRPLMPAPGGAERVVGNNPLAVAVPKRAVLFPTTGRSRPMARRRSTRQRPSPACCCPQAGRRGSALLLPSI
jgi:LDH2 family malate/lactate/ureidoglycolate dehydrogenase